MSNRTSTIERDPWNSKHTPRPAQNRTRRSRSEHEVANHRKEIIRRRRLGLGATVLGLVFSVAAASNFAGESPDANAVGGDVLPKAENEHVMTVSNNETSIEDVQAVVLDSEGKVIGTVSNDGVESRAETKAIKAIDSESTMKLVESSGLEIEPAVYDYEDLIGEESQKVGIDKDFVLAYINAESEGNRKAVSPNVGALGLGQLMPQYNIEKMVELGYLPQSASWEDYKKAEEDEASKLSLAEYKKAFFNPEANIKVSLDNYKWILGSIHKNHPDREFNDLRSHVQAAAKYNQGHFEKTFGEYPDETKKYMVKIGMEEIRLKLGAMAENGATVTEVVHARKAFFVQLREVTAQDLSPYK